MAPDPTGGHDAATAFDESDYLNADPWTRFDLWAERARDMALAAIGVAAEAQEAGGVWDPRQDAMLSASTTFAELAASAVPMHADVPAGSIRDA